MQDRVAEIIPCRACGNMGNEKYCGQCGQERSPKRITLPGLLHDALHAFVHLEKGFGFTLKKLLLAPGKMQREYVEGNRAKFQKPVSMFLLCATIDAVGRYWLYSFISSYFKSDNIAEANFFHQYMVLLYAALIPVFSFVTWIVFYNRRYNYAETGVMMLYLFSFAFVAVFLIACLKLIWINLDTAYIELPLLLIYNAITLVKFYQGSNKWLVIVKSVLLMCFLFWTAQQMENLVQRVMGHH